MAKRRSLVLALTSAFACSPAFAAPEESADAVQTPAPYVDRLIADGNLAPLATRDSESELNTNGNVRSLIVELGGSAIDPQFSISGLDTTSMDRLQREAGILVSSRYQTDNFGLLGLDAQLQRGSNTKFSAGSPQDRWSGSLSLTSRDLPLGNGWLADSSLGTTTIPAIPLVRQQVRFYLPSTPILGGTATFKAYSPLEPSQTSIDPVPTSTFNLSLGEPGLLGGLRVSNFSGLSGIALSAGGQVNLGSGFDAGIQVIAIDKSQDPYALVFRTASNESTRALSSSQAALGTIAYSKEQLRIQASAVVSHRSGASFGDDLQSRGPTAGGGWLDASYRAGSSRHSGGLYYFGPGLTWGTSSLINNVYGGYYRFYTSSQRWRWTLNIDAADSIDGSGSGGVIINADARRKLNFTTAIGVNSTLRVRNHQTATQLLGFIDFSSDLGSSRAEAGWSHDAFADLYRAGFNQEWSLPSWLPSGSRLSTQFSYERRRQLQRSPELLIAQRSETASNFGAGISAGATPFNGLSIDANLAYNSNASSFATSLLGPLEDLGSPLSSLSSEEGRAFSANLALTARLSHSWSLSAGYTDTTSRLTSFFGLQPFPLALGQPLQADDPVRSTFRLRAGFLTLRYSGSAGRPKGSLGIRQFPVGGTGNLDGRIYLDGNDNGKREPSEVGVAGIVVILDGFQAVRTDQSGYYRFDGVSDGPHRITLNTDMLPLPWVIEPADKPGSGEPFSTIVEIAVRSSTELDIAASNR